MTTKVIIQKLESEFYHITHPEGGRSVRVSIQQPFTADDEALIELTHATNHLQERAARSDYFFDVASISNNGGLSATDSGKTILLFLKKKELIDDRPLLQAVGRIGMIFKR
jgi:hypothetical protein